MSYASGKYAYGICDISGFRYKLKDMKKTWDGLLVGPDQFDPKHPQLEPTTHVADPEALYNARPNTDVEANDGRVYTPTNIIGRSFEGFKITSALGTVTITT
jgi:hypothetical protein|tara:strand:+ start:503 stop:808 length:306 start_codon:yes stop_codon:yes gene_type:complete